MVALFSDEDLQRFNLRMSRDSTMAVVAVRLYASWLVFDSKGWLAQLHRIGFCKKRLQISNSGHLLHHTLYSSENVP